MLSPVRTLAAIGFLGAGLLAQQLPELFYYRFNEGAGSTTLNEAVPGAGSLMAAVNGHMLTPPPAGQFQDGCMTAVTGTGNFVDTGWPVAFGTGSWTISFWLDLTALPTFTTVAYLFGDPTALQLRCFTNGAAGAGNVILRGGPLADAICPGGASTTAPQAIAFAYDASVPEIRVYRNGVLVNTAAQPALNVVGTANLHVGGQLSSMPTGSRLDEFRVYNRALGAPEIAATWNLALLGTSMQPSLTTVGTGCPGTGGLVPTLSSAQLPSIGNSAFILDINQAAPNSSAFLFLSAGMAPTPLPIGGSCLVYLETTSLFSLIALGILPIGPLPTGPTGATSLLLSIPNDPLLAGTEVGLQAAVSDAGSPLGFTLTNALLAVIN